MKIASFNVRGLGNKVKWRKIRDIIAKEGVDMMCIQETKMKLIDRKICNAVWGDSNVEWRFIPAINNGGGLLCLWHDSAFKLENCFCGYNFVALQGVWEGKECVVISVYAPCNLV